MFDNVISIESDYYKGDHDILILENETIKKVDFYGGNKYSTIDKKIVKG